MRHGRNGDIDMKRQSRHGEERGRKRGRRGGGGEERAQRLRDRATEKNTNTAKPQDRDAQIGR